LSYGWINRELFASGNFLEHINAFGGEDRFWIGPEGGQFFVFFKKDVPFNLENWYTPAAIDTEPFDVISTSRDEVQFKKLMRLENYSGTVFDMRVDRSVRLLKKNELDKIPGIAQGKNLKTVAYESVNRMTNTGDNEWVKETGLLSVWILGMYNPSPGVTIVIPYKPGDESDLGPIVNDEYFGKVPADRLIIADDVIFFKGDGQYRSKIGLLPQRAKSVLGSYDEVNNVLTIVQYTKPEGVVDYVNSMWELQEQPYRGDVINSYNDGPPAPGAKPLGPFYELETSSAAAALAPGESIEHIHRTIHFTGADNDLDSIAKAILGVSIEEIKAVF
jgi:hypothetical protein